MKLTVMKPVEIEVTHIRVQVPVKYGTEDIPDDFPFRSGKEWDVTVDIAEGRIVDWPKDAGAKECSMKVTDAGSYYLMSLDEVVVSRVQEYVPTCIPGEYGDYIKFRIGADGVVENWKRFCTADRIMESFYPKEDE